MVDALASLLPVLLMNKSSYEMFTILLVTLFPKLIEWLSKKQLVTQVWKKKNEECSVTLIMSWTVVKSETHRECSNYYHSVLDKVRKVMEVKKIKCHETWIRGSCFVLTPNKFEVEDGIHAKLVLQKVSEVSGEHGYTCRYDYKIILLGSDYRTLTEAVVEWNRAFENIGNKPMQYIYRHTGFEQHKAPVVSRLVLTTTKTFDTLFFEKKQELITRIDFFTKNEDRYRKLGMPYTLGMMFHGVPGSGKTSCIKAIAKHTGRDVFILNPHVIKTAEQLMNALTCLSVYTVGAACYMSDVKNRLFVIEEIDCTAWKDIVKPRTSGGGGEEPPPPTLMVPSPFAPLEDAKKMMMMEEKEQKFTLSDLLEILDGMIESDGRMIVFTTNHPENLDPALLRPGRIDMIVEFTNMTRKNVSDMYQVWFDKKPPKDVYHAMKDYTFSQAEIGQLFSTLDMDRIHATLSSN